MINEKIKALINCFSYINLVDTIFWDNCLKIYYVKEDGLHFIVGYKRFIISQGEIKK